VRAVLGVGACTRSEGSDCAWPVELRLGCFGLLFLAAWLALVGAGAFGGTRAGCLTVGALRIVAVMAPSRVDEAAEDEGCGWTDE
jgi:hypothetical protein